MEDKKETTSYIFLVATLLCLVCAVFVSFAAVGLKPIQDKNRLIDKKRNILQAAKIYNPKQGVEEQFEAVETKVINYNSGEILQDADVLDYMTAIKKPDKSVSVPAAIDIGKLKKRPKKGEVYLVKESGEIKKVILPIVTKGLWSTMLGFLVLDSDLKTIRNISFYQHGETPGLGGEVDNPRWKAQWDGKNLYNEEGEASITIIKGTVSSEDPQSQYKIDGLSGATITAVGVQNGLRYWAGEHGYKPFLQKLREMLNRAVVMR